MTDLIRVNYESERPTILDREEEPRMENITNLERLTELLKKNLDELDQATHPETELKQLYTIKTIASELSNEADKLFADKFYSVVDGKPGLKPIII
jgi:hypothetical protein